MDMIGKDAIIPIMPQKEEREKTLSQKILRRIWRRGRGSVFSGDDLADLGDRAAIDLVLARLAKQGRIRRIARGLYDYPLIDPVLGMLSPSVDAIAAALAGAGRLRLQPSGAYAANLLGLSDQVPMKIVFLSDGPTKHVVVGGREIILKRTTPRNMAAAGRLGGLVVQALRYIGESGIDEAAIARLLVAVPSEQRAGVLKDALGAPAWIRALLDRVLEGGGAVR